MIRKVALLFDNTDILVCLPMLICCFRETLTRYSFILISFWIQFAFIIIVSSLDDIEPTPFQFLVTWTMQSDGPFASSIRCSICAMLLMYLLLKRFRHSTGQGRFSHTTKLSVATKYLILIYRLKNLLEQDALTISQMVLQTEHDRQVRLTWLLDRRLYDRSGYNCPSSSVSLGTKPVADVRKRLPNDNKQLREELGPLEMTNHDNHRLEFTVVTKPKGKSQPPDHLLYQLW